MFLISLVIVAGIIWHNGANTIVETMQLQGKAMQIALLAATRVVRVLGIIHADYIEIPSKLGCVLRQHHSALGRFYNDGEIMASTNVNRNAVSIKNVIGARI